MFSFILASYRIKLDHSFKRLKTPFIFIYLSLVYKYNKYLFLPFRQKFSLIKKKIHFYFYCANILYLNIV